ncbi:hypothetical protein Anapl_00012 [Anas platyrhynchos]|uniref:Uncharacterized protein n=1 Tax=Anas platyrhynchos TaxID=8839 RepID=R0K1M4_ANAPL|nr:hypothetical protein Anapl_00012 [Anas platyrhynchos]
MNAMLRQRRKDDEMRAQGTEGSNEVPLPNAGSCTGCSEDPRTQCPHIKASKDFWRGRLGCSGTAEGRCISPHSSLGAFTLGCSSRRPSKHTVMAQPWCSLLGDLLAQRWVPVGTGLGDHNEEGSSRMGFHELTGEVLDLQLLRCSPCLGAVLIASSSSAGLESHSCRGNPLRLQGESPSHGKAGRQPVPESLCVYFWARFCPKARFPGKDAGHAHVDAIPKIHNKLCLLSSASGGTSSWAVRDLSAGSTNKARALFLQHVASTAGAGSPEESLECGQKVPKAQRKESRGMQAWGAPGAPALPASPGDVMPPGDVIPLQPNIEVPQHPSESRAAVNHLQGRSRDSELHKTWIISAYSDNFITCTDLLTHWVSPCTRLSSGGDTGTRPGFEVPRQMRNWTVFDVPVNYMDSGKRLLRDYIGVTNHRKKGLDLNFETQCVELRTGAYKMSEGEAQQQALDTSITDSTHSPQISLLSSGTTGRSRSKAMWMLESSISMGCSFEIVLTLECLVLHTEGGSACLGRSSYICNPSPAGPAKVLRSLNCNHVGDKTLISFSDESGKFGGNGDTTSFVRAPSPATTSAIKPVLLFGTPEELSRCLPPVVLLRAADPHLDCHPSANPDGDPAAGLSWSMET